MNVLRSKETVLKYKVEFLDKTVLVKNIVFSGI